MTGPLLAACLWIASAPPAPATVELADENLGELVNQITAKAKVTDLIVERSDVFSGTESVKQSGNERHHNILKGWAYKIVETPKAADEFRYLRFAWRKEGGGSILIAFAINGGQWSGNRYAAGPYNLGGSGFSTGDKAPVEWTVVTRDMFKDFGELTLSSVLFSSANGGTAYFDHILLGRTIDDLDRHTAESIGKGKLPVPLTGTVRDETWQDLIGEDKAKANVAFRKFLSVATDQVEYIRGRLPKPKLDPVQLAKITSHIRQLDSEQFEERLAASEALRSIGSPAVPHLQALLEKEESAETTYRAKAILLKLGVKPGDTLPAQARAARIVRILERANTNEAMKLLNALADGEYGNDYISEGRAALGRMKVPK